MEFFKEVEDSVPLNVLVTHLQIIEILLVIIATFVVFK